MRKLYLIGSGMGDPLLLTEEAKQIMKTADVLYATKRIAAVCTFRVPEILSLPDILRHIMENPMETQAVLVSGDPGLYSAVSYFRKNLPDMEILPVCGISSLQYMSARIGRGYESVKILSMHGREVPFLSVVSMHEEVFMLTGGVRKAHDLLKIMNDSGLGGIEVWAGEALSGPEERILHGRARDLKDETFSDLTVLWCVNENPAVPCTVYPDKAFVRGNVPMTKETLRWFILKELKLRPSDIVWDLGAGTGSVSVQCASFLTEGAVFAVDQNAEAIMLIEENRKKHGLFHIFPVLGRAPEACSGLADPDAVYIGGSDGNMKEMLSYVQMRNPKARLVITAVTMETLETVRHASKELKIPFHMQRVLVEKERPLGRYTIMEAEHAVWLLTKEGAE